MSDAAQTPSSGTQVYVTLGAAVAVGVGGLLTGALIGWAWRGAKEKELAGSREKRRLRTSGEER